MITIGQATKRTFLWIVIGLLVVFSIACMEQGKQADQGSQTEGKSDATARKANEFTFGAATQGGFWYLFAGALGDEIKKEIASSSVAVVEGGSISNVLGIEAGKFQIGFSNGEAVPEALQGSGEFKEKAEKIRWIATLYPNVFQVVVRADSDIQSIEDLKGKRVSPGIKGYSGELAFKKVLEQYGMSYDDLAKIEYIGTADAGDLLRDGHIDAIVQIVAVPLSTFQELDTTIGIRVLPLPDDIVAKMNKANEGYQPYTIKGGTYAGVPDDIPTFTAYTTLLASKDLDEDTVYTLTKLIVERADKWKALNTVMAPFDGKYSVDNMIGPIHPGAEKYYKEKGFMKK
ncbi:TAXI family TRAP transporter solute-binding subunit [Numidum massiliense]|uniref:TAXI family TRAP transporter solute-binding subunit n=1 Tax=Numidum massiliense TaxID=1522315 RepID=UPI0006D59AE8|nr:TAXI family TRAP transporter solute-binding subunit [Numidum massiliense]